MLTNAARCCGDRAREQTGREKAAMKLLLGSTALALALGVGAYLSDPAPAQQVQYACDENADGYIDATESRLCTDAEFDEIAAGEQVLTEELLSVRAEGQEGMPSFADVDQNGDGQISREEWIAFGEQRFAGAAEASGGRMSTEEYSTWRQQGMRP
jgi:EF hand